MMPRRIEVCPLPPGRTGRARWRGLPSSRMPEVGDGGEPVFPPNLGAGTAFVMRVEPNPHPVRRAATVALGWVPVVGDVVEVTDESASRLRVSFARASTGEVALVKVINVS